MYKLYICKITTVPLYAHSFEQYYIHIQHGRVIMLLQLYLLQETDVCSETVQANVVER